MVPACFICNAKLNKFLPYSQTTSKNGLQQDFQYCKKSYLWYITFSKAAQTVEKPQKTNTRENQVYHRMNNQLYVHSWEEYDYE